MKFIKKYLLIVLLIFIILFRIASDEIFYEHWFNIKFVSYILILILMLLLYNFKKILKEKYFLEAVTIILVGSYLFSLILLYPINFYNKNYYIENETTLSEICEINGVSKRRMSRGYYFKFKESSHWVRGQSQDLYKIEKNINDYLIVVEYKKGLFNSYIFTNKQIIDNLN